MESIWTTICKERKMLILLTELGYKKLYEYHETIKDLQMSATITNTLLRDLMDYAQLKNNTFKLEKEYFNFSDLVQKAFKQVALLAEKRNLKLEGPIFPNKHDAVYFKQVLGDKMRYMQIMTNFLTNAIKFSVPGGIVSILLRVGDVSSRDQLYRQSDVKIKSGPTFKHSGSDSSSMFQSEEVKKTAKKFYSGSQKKSNNFNEIDIQD